MPQLKIKIREWKQEVSSAGLYPAYSSECLEVIEQKIRGGSGRSYTPSDDSSTATWVGEFVDGFAPELQEILGMDREAILGMLTDPGAPVSGPDWNTILADPERRDSACRAMVAKLLAAVFAYDDNGEEKDDKGDVNDQAGKAAENEDQSDSPDDLTDDKTDSQPESDPVIPAEFFGRGAVSQDVTRALQTDEVVHGAWRRALTTAQDLLLAFGSWLEAAGMEQPSRFARVGLAQAELRDINDHVEFSRQVIQPNVEISVPVEPPLHLLSGHPSYDHQDLQLTLAPFVAKQMTGEQLPEGWNMGLSPDNTTVIVRNWCQTDPSDLKRLGELFVRLRNMVRRPQKSDAYFVEDQRIPAALDNFGGVVMPGFAPCWRQLGDTVVGLRPVVFYQNGTYHKNQLQLTQVLGPAGDEPLPPDLSDQLVRHGTVMIWPDNDLLFLGFTVDDLSDLEPSRFHDFAEFGREVALGLRECGALSPDPLDEWVDRLKTMPRRLEMDFNRLQQHWRRRRYADNLQHYLASGDAEKAKALVAGIEDREDQNHLRAQFVANQFAVDPTVALAELETVEPGNDRHETILAVMEVAVENEASDLLEKVFAGWLTADARSEQYEPSCTPIFELIATGLGLETLLETYPEEIHPAVQCDWLNFVLRRVPRTRRDLEWITRVDSLVNDDKGLELLDLDRLAELFDTLRKFGLSGREVIVDVVKRLIKASPYREYYENRFGIRLGETRPPAET